MVTMGIEWKWVGGERKREREMEWMDRVEESDFVAWRFTRPISLWCLRAERSSLCIALLHSTLQASRGGPNDDDDDAEAEPRKQELPYDVQHVPCITRLCTHGYTYTRPPRTGTASPLCTREK